MEDIILKKDMIYILSYIFLFFVDERKIKISKITLLMRVTTLVHYWASLIAQYECVAFNSLYRHKTKQNSSGLTATNANDISKKRCWHFQLKSTSNPLFKYNTRKHKPYENHLPSLKLAMQILHIEKMH